MPRVNVTSAAESVVAAATRRTGKLVGNALNRGPNSVFFRADESGNVNAATDDELKIDEALNFELSPGEDVRARCAAGETARLDVTLADEE